MEWAGAVAPKATILYVYSTNVDASATDAIDQKLAPVMTYSFGIWRRSCPGSSQTALEYQAQKASGLGITWVASAGDSGAATCDGAFNPNAAAASGGLAVSYPASVPEVTGVGGTQFNEGGGNFWAQSNSANEGSALSYIPEIGWNESGSGGLASSGGGLSVLFTNPPWQVGAGVPATKARAVPDIALSAAAHDGYLTFSGNTFYINTGTSAAAPSFAGILAILNQYVGGGQGNINPNLYRLAQTSAGAFHDITTGNNIVPCGAGTPNCASGSFGYSAGPGYDLVTGLGSIDAYNLVTHWSNQTLNTTTAVSGVPANISLSGATVLTATVKAAGSSAVPTGAVSFNASNGSSAISLGSAPAVNSGGAATAALNVTGGQFKTAGTYTITAVYGGDSKFNGSSGTATVAVSTPSANSAVIPSISPNPLYQQPADSDGYSWFYTVTLKEAAGRPRR